MNKLLTAAAIVASLGVALPAAAQTWGGGYGGGYNGQFRGDVRGDSFRGDGFRGGVSGDRSIETRIDRGVRNGSLTQFEARALSRQLDEIHRAEWQYRRDGISGREARDLDRRYASLEARLRVEARDRDTRFGDRGYGQGYGRGFDGYR